MSPSALHAMLISMINCELKKSLLIVELPDGYANACIVKAKIYTASHVVPSPRRIRVPESDEVGDFTFEQLPGHDLAISHASVYIDGIINYTQALVGDLLTVFGHHGPARNDFAIPAIITAVDALGRATIESQDHPFQPGMSGSPALNLSGAIVGLLVRSESQDGKKVLLEPVHAK